MLPVDGRYEEAGAGRGRAGRPARKARVTIAMEAYSMPASSAAATGATSASRRAVGAPGVASTTSSASTSSGAVVGPTTSAKPVGVRRSSRTVAFVRTSSPDRRAATGSRPSPPAIPANTGAPGLLRQGLRGRRRPGTRHSKRPAEARSRVRRGGGRGRRTRRRAAVRRAGRRPRLRAVAATSSPTDTSSPSASRDPVTSWRRRSTPASLSTPEAAACSTSAGTPITERGRGLSAPLVQTEDEVVAGWTTGSPTSRARSTPSGRRASIDSAPTSISNPATTSWPQLAADPVGALEHQHLATQGGQVARGGQARDAASDDHAAARRGGTWVQPVTRARRNRPPRRPRRTPMRTTRLMPRTLSRSSTWAAAGAAALILSLTACSGGSDDSRDECKMPMVAAPTWRRRRLRLRPTTA